MDKVIGARHWLEKIKRIVQSPHLALIVVMFDHIGIFASDAEKSIPFFEVCLEPLGIKIYQRQPEWGSAIFAGKSGVPFLWIGPAQGDYHGTPISPRVHSPMHLAFTATTKRAVDDFHRIGLLQGGKSNGSPEEYPDGSYNAFLLDPDGNNIEAIYRK